MMKQLRSHPWLNVAGLGALILIGGAGYWGGYHIASAHYKALVADFTPYLEQSVEYPLVAPLLGIRAPEATELGEYQPLKDAIQQDIDAAKATGHVNSVSVYFRDLDTSRWLGINQDADYYPASLLKVPILIAYYKEAEANPSILNQEIPYTVFQTGDPFEVPSSLVVGRSYTVEQLIEAMIENSDNGATFALLGNINNDTLDDVYANLGIQDPGDNSANYQISTRTYALFFRILYNATYLDPEYSQRALALLSRSTFTQGLAAGVPAGVQVAHKFGEHVLSSGDTITGVELSDCGVTYYPSHPYLLCVMTSTADATTSEEVIRNISATAYAAVAAEYATSTSK